MVNYFFDILFFLGSTVTDSLKFLIGYFNFSVKILGMFFEAKTFNPAIFMITNRHIYYNGVQLFFIVTITSIVVGLAVVGGLGNLLIMAGAKGFLGDMLTLTLIRSIGPLVCGLLIVLRTSSALFVEIGLMQYRNEMEAIVDMGIDPFKFVFIPRIFAGIISMVVLSIYFVVASIIGGYTLLSFQLDTTLDVILSQVIYCISFKDIMIFMFKTVAIGFVSTSIPIFSSFENDGSTTDITASLARGMMRLFFAFVFIFLVGDLLW